MILNNEVMIFFVIIILIGLTYYDLKYSIIFCIILYLVYLYFNKLTFESNHDEYKQYDEKVNNILRNIEIYRNFDNQNYKLGLKYHNYVLKNIKLLNNINDKYYFQSILEKTRVYLEITIEKFNSILFSIADMVESKRLNKLIMNLNEQFNRLINDSITAYNNKLKNTMDCNNSMFCNKDLILNYYLDLDIDKKIDINKPILDHHIFDRGLYIGLDKGNEVYYDHEVGIEKNLRSMLMNKYNNEDMIPRKGFTDLDDLPKNDKSTKYDQHYHGEKPVDSFYSKKDWSYINHDRNENAEQRKNVKSNIDSYIYKISNNTSKTEYNEEYIDNIFREYLNIYNNN